MASVKNFNVLLTAEDSVSNLMDPGVSLICTWIIFSGSVIGNYMKLFSSLYLRLKVTVILTLLSPLSLLGFDFSQNEMLLHCTGCINLFIIKIESDFFLRENEISISIYMTFHAAEA
jgi:hypothetical protein